MERSGSSRRCARCGSAQPGNPRRLRLPGYDFLACRRHAIKHRHTSRRRGRRFLGEEIAAIFIVAVVIRPGQITSGSPVGRDTRRLASDMTTPGRPAVLCNRDRPAQNEAARPSKEPIRSKSLAVINPSLGNFQPDVIDTRWAGPLRPGSTGLLYCSHWYDRQGSGLQQIILRKDGQPIHEETHQNRRQANAGAMKSWNWRARPLHQSCFVAIGVRRPPTPTLPHEGGGL